MKRTSREMTKLAEDEMTIREWTTRVLDVRCEWWHQGRSAMVRNIAGKTTVSMGSKGAKDVRGEERWKSQRGCWLSHEATERPFTSQ